MSLEHVDKKLSLNTENLFKNIWINCYHILFPSLMNLTAARFILLTNYLTINSDSPWNGLTKIQLLIYTDIFFSNLIDPRVVKMLTYCKKKKKKDEKWQILLFSCYWPSVYLIHYRWNSRSYSFTDLIRLVLTVYNCMKKMSISPQTPSIT